MTAKMKVDVIQNSAISFSVCVDNKFNNLEKLLELLKAKFKVECYENVSLYTVRPANSEAIDALEGGEGNLAKTALQDTVQIVTR